MIEIFDLVNLDDPDDPYRDIIRHFNMSIDEGGEFYDQIRARVAFYKHAVSIIMGPGVPDETPYDCMRFDALNGMTPFETIVNERQEGLKKVIAHLVQNYSM